MSFMRRSCYVPGTIMTTFKTYFAWWGKASTCLPPSRQQFPGWHPLPFHALDVAAVAYEYLSRSRSLQALFKDCLPELGQEALCRWFAFWLALHDLGKFAQAFASAFGKVMNLDRFDLA